MIIKISNRKLVESSNKIAKMSKEELPIKVSYALTKNISKINTELTIYEAEKKKLIDKYCEKDTDGKLIIDNDNNIKIKDECIEDFTKDFNSLLDIETEIDIHQFSIDLLENYTISAVELSLIDFMFIE